MPRVSLAVAIAATGCGIHIMLKGSGRSHNYSPNTPLPIAVHRFDGKHSARLCEFYDIGIEKTVGNTWPWPLCELYGKPMGSTTDPQRIGHVIYHPKTGEFVGFYIKPEWRGYGIGKMMCTAATKDIVLNGTAKEVWVKTNPHNYASNTWLSMWKAKLNTDVDGRCVYWLADIVTQVAKLPSLPNIKQPMRKEIVDKLSDEESHV